MTIKRKIILGFLLSTTILAGCIVTQLAVSMREMATRNYEMSSAQQLKLMEAYVGSIMNTAERDVALLGTAPITARGLNNFQAFGNTSQDTVTTHEELPEVAQLIAKRFLRLQNINSHYVEVFAGYSDGSFATSHSPGTVPAKYNPVERSWYTECLESNKSGGLSESYLSITGNVVVPAVHKIFDEQGKAIGVVGIDIALDELSEYFKKLNFGETGHFILIENSGRVLCSPKQPKLLGKTVDKDAETADLSNLFATKDGLNSATVQGTKMLANVLTNDHGWKIISLQSAKEIYAATNSAILSIVLISTVILAIILLAAYYLIIRSINIPLNKLMLFANNIAKGDLSEQLEPKGFFGELLNLKGSLENMVENLRNMISAAEEKSAEAERQTRVAKTAVQETEKARLAAERAKQDGMHAAAEQLESFVASLHAASTQLLVQIEQSNTISTESSGRLGEAATAMNQMNLTIQEVAHNASRAASVSEDTRKSAQEGERIVGEVLGSISQARSYSQDLKVAMENLNTNAQDIDKIMGVISDIADQTNLLALNAAIEAARAGEAGRGFAVVADEVRKLAEKTMHSTLDVANVVKVIQEGTATSVVSVDSALNQVENASELANKSGTALREIVNQVGSAADEIGSIATASEEQSAASEEINQSISNINELSEQTAQAMREASSAVSDLAKLAEELQSLIVQMKEEN